MGSGLVLPVAGQPTQGPDPGFVQSPSNRLVSINADHIGPPSALYIDVNDRFVLEMSSTVPETVQWQGRLLLPSGELKQIGGQISNGSSTFALFKQITPLAEGFLLSIAVGPTAASQRGQTFVRGYISRPVTLGFSDAAQFLFADYIWQDNTSHNLVMIAGWPGGSIRSPLDPPGQMQTRSAGVIGAGSDWSIGLASQTRIRYRSFAATFVTSATVATRLPRIQIKVNGNVVWQGPPSQGVPASQTVVVSSAPGATLGTVADTQTVLVPLPSDPFFSGQGLAIASSTTAIQAGDQWSNIFLYTEEMLEV